MTPQEKAKELLIKMGYIEGELMAMNYIAKRQALIVVDELLDSHWNDRECGIGSKVQFYRMVKSEIKKL